MAAANVYGVVIAVHTRGQAYITKPQEGRVLIPEPIELELDHQHYAARVGPAQEPSPAVLPSPDPEREVVDLSLDDDAFLDTDPLLTPEEVEEIGKQDVESQSLTVIPDPPVPDALSVGSAVSSYTAREGQSSRPQSLVDHARKSPFADIFRKLQKTKQSQSVSQGAQLVDNQKVFLRAVGSRPKPGEFTKAEGELWVNLYDKYLKWQQPFVAMHNEWQRHPDEDQILYRTNAELRKLQDTAKGRNCFPQDEGPEGETPNPDQDVEAPVDEAVEETASSSTATQGGTHTVVLKLTLRHKTDFTDRAAASAASAASARSFRSFRRFYVSFLISLISYLA